MDDTKLIFEKIRHRDNDSFHILTENYGWKLYSYIRKNTESRELADQIFSETLSKFQENAEKYDSSDPIEAMLCLYADTLYEEHRRAGTSGLPGSQNPAYSSAAGNVPPKKKHKAGAAILYTICILLLLAAIAAALWFLVGMLVDMSILPQEWDFGYSWFNLNIADIF